MPCMQATDDWSQIVVEGGHHNKAAREAFAGSDIVMTGYWNATVELSDHHRDVSDGRGHECGCAVPISGFNFVSITGHGKL